MRPPLLARELATWFGCRYVPKAPGTAGALGALPLRWALSLCPTSVQIIGTGAVAALGFWASNEVAKALGDEDPQCVVIDEVAGTLIAIGLVAGRSLAARSLAFGLFRFFDIVKPGIINKVQHARPFGVGIMADDLLAGVAAGLLARFLTKARGA